MSWPRFAANLGAPPPNYRAQADFVAPLKVLATCPCSAGAPKPLSAVRWAAATMSESKEWVGPWDYFHLQPAERWFAEASAFVTSAEQLFSAICRGDLDREWLNAKAAGFAFGHGLELFLKAGLLLAGKPAGNVHDLDQLYRTFLNLFPGKQFEFAAPIAAFIEAHADNPFHIFLKYPEDESQIGVTWNASVTIRPEDWLLKIAVFKVDMNRIWPRMQERYPQAKPGSASS